MFCKLEQFLQMLHMLFIFRDLYVNALVCYRDFAYVARDPNTGKHKCHMFRCHGNISGRAITNALHEMCNRILEEKKRAKHEAKKKSTDKQSWSDIINTPPPPSVKGQFPF